MLPTINGKQIVDCSLEDLQAILNNPDYCEGQFIDYKREFSAGKQSQSKRKDSISELKNDICSFANAEGGYLVYGVEEVNGIATRINGIEIKENNTESFERDIKNWASYIQPHMPACQFKFIPLDNGRHVVIILIKHDGFAPYFHIEDETAYRFFKRVGNDKRTMKYTELKKAFSDSLDINKEIELYREGRISYFVHNGYKRFLLINIIPETFTDPSYNQHVYLLNNKTNGALANVFSPFSCFYKTASVTDGFVRTMLKNDYYLHECRLSNNFIAEAFDTLEHEVQRSTDYNDTSEYFPWKYIWDKIEELVKNYSTEVKKHLSSNRFFVLISIIGCAEVLTEKPFFTLVPSKIDRDKLLMSPCRFDNNSLSIEKAMKQLKLEYYLALGLTGNQEFRKLTEELA